jgi:hypothetical protein
MAGGPQKRESSGPDYFAAIVRRSVDFERSLGREIRQFGTKGVEFPDVKRLAPCSAVVHEGCLFAVC